ncbi:helix-turn-helix domain-containing protein [Streptomyces anulatus]|uniref:helix-turn-helix domain-containing protein n=1 Tax=Streptomyces anulatus TaxID=1892 RepID=UPI0036BFA182
MTLLRLHLTIAGFTIETRIERTPDAMTATAQPTDVIAADRDDRIRDRHRAGASTRTIAAEVGLHHSTVARILATPEGARHDHTD